MWEVRATVIFCVEYIDEAYKLEGELHRLVGEYDPVRGKLWSSKETKLNPFAERSYREAKTKNWRE